MIDIKRLTSHPKLQNYVIAYIDILGVRNLLSSGKTAESFESIYYQFLIADALMPSLPSLDCSDIKVKIFSDNILIAFPVETKDDSTSVFKSYSKATNYLQFFLSMFVNKGILFRGAITLGELMINDLMVWGKGLLDAVALEENIAIYPRIIVSDELFRILEETAESGYCDVDQLSCIKDFDGCMYFDYFNYNDPKGTNADLSYAIEYIEEKLKLESNERIMQKYRWYRNYLKLVEEKYNSILSDCKK